MTARRFDGGRPYPALLTLTRVAAIASLLLMVLAWLKSTDNPTIVGVALLGFVLSAVFVILSALVAGSQTFRRKAWEAASSAARFRFALLLALNSVAAAAIWLALASQRW